MQPANRTCTTNFSNNATENLCVCPRCRHPTCPLPSAEPPYDEIAHEVDRNFISVKVPKNMGKFDPEDLDPEKRDKLSFDFNCADSEGEKCKTGCTKVHVTPNQYPPLKKPDEEMFSLKTVRHITSNDDLKSTLEIEFKAPRNYIPLPELGPTPPIIVPKQRFRKKRKGGGKGKGKRTNYENGASPFAARKHTLFETTGNGLTPLLK